MGNYDPNYSYGTHKVEITLQQWGYRGTITIEIGGNCKGLSILKSACDSIFDCFDNETLVSDCNFNIIEDDDGEFWYRAYLKDESGEIMETEDCLIDLEKSIVSVKIIDFIERK